MTYPAHLAQPHGLREPRLSTPEDIDSRTGTRRLLVDSYELHADVIDTARVAFGASIREALKFLELDLEKLDDLFLDPRVREGAELRIGTWVEDLWQIEHSCRALGIED